MEVFFVIWLMFAIACAFIADQKGHNAAAWFFIGAIGGIFGLVVICAIPKKEA